MSSDYFYWTGGPEIVEIGPVVLPFPISLIGLLAGVVLYFLAANYWVSQKMEKSAKSKKKKTVTQEDAALSYSQSIGLFIGSLIIAQLLFAIIGVGMSQEVGPIVLRWYGLLFASAFICGYFLTRKLFRDAGRSLEEVDALLIYVMVATIAGARLGEVFFYEFSYYARNPIEIFYIWQGGLASHGAAIGILLGLWLYVRKQSNMSLFWLTDRIALPVIIGGAFVRLGNFFNHEIYGSVTDVSWAVIFSRVDLLPRHPTMLYEAVACVLIFALLMGLYFKYKNKPPVGLLTGVFMITLFSARFLIEFTKDQEQFSPDYALGMGQLLSIPFVIFGIWLLVSKVNWKST